MFSIVYQLSLCYVGGAPIALLVAACYTYIVSWVWLKVTVGGTKSFTSQEAMGARITGIGVHYCDHVLLQ